MPQSCAPAQRPVVDLVFNVGCGVDIAHIQMMYGRTFPRKPTLGCGVVLDGCEAIFVPMP